MALKKDIRSIPSVVIDGAEGEGGGQIIRTSLALSLVTGKPFEMRRIRAGRAKPGLLRQHLAAVRAAREIGDATLDGAELGSQTLSFQPGPIRPGRYRFAVGTAGSAVLVLQTVLPALLACGGVSSLELEGGTHNPMAPTFDFLSKAFLPLVNRMGPKIQATLSRPGFYPAGGGKFTVEIEPAERLRPLSLLDRGEILRREARVLIAGLPQTIAAREIEILREKLAWPEDSYRVEALPEAFGPGNVISLEIVSENITEVFTAFGEKGVPSESVAGKLVGEARDYLAAGPPVARHLADQLMIPFALAGSGRFKTHALSLHARTNIGMILKFLDVKIEVEDLENRTCLVRFGP